MSLRATLVLGLVASAVGCGPPLIEGEGIFAVRNGTLIDGTGAPARPNTTVIFVEGRIDRIVDAGSVRIGPNVPSIDATGQWIVPGFIDTHAHLLGGNALERTLSALLNHGITAARSTATATAYAVEVRDRLDSGELAGPTYRVAGALLDGPGSPHGFASIVETPDQARAEVRLQAQAGVDYIKVYTLLPPDVVAAAIEEAHSLGLEVIGHIGYTTWLDALDMNIDALTHSAFAGMASSLVPAEERSAFSEFFIPNSSFDPSQFQAWIEVVDQDLVRELGRRIADQQVVLDPNLVLMEAIIRGDDPDVYDALVTADGRQPFSPHPYSAGWSQAERAAAQKALPIFFDAVRTFWEEGALITVGTDLGNPWMTPGVSFHRELELLAQAGLTNHEVLLAATRNGAIAIARLGDLGTVEVGKRADIVVLSADPLADIRNTTQIVGVYQGGRRVGG